MSPRSHREREARRDAWVASGAQDAQERLQGALTAAGVGFNPLLVGVTGTPDTKRAAVLHVTGEEVDQLIAALERAALPVDQSTPDERVTADVPKIETGNHPRGGFFATAGKLTARGETPAEATAALRARLARQAGEPE